MCQGYDVRDSESIWTKFRTIKDIDMFIVEAKSRGMKLIMDLAVNHTNNEYALFQDIKKSIANPEFDWYIWRNPEADYQGERRSLNNWRAAFGYNVWTYVAGRDQYYLHLCLEKQPDIN